VTSWGRLDFRIYHGALSFHGSIYDYKHDDIGLGFTYPPFAALVLRPFTLLTAAPAEKVWFLASLAMTAAFVLVCVRALPATTPAWIRALGAAYMLVVMPVSLTLRFGQINALISLLIAIEIVLISRNSRAAGVGLGLATALKVTPAFVIVALALSGRARAATTAVLTAVAATLLAATAYTHDTWRYFTETIFETRRVGSLSVAYSNSLRRLIVWLHLGDRLGSLVWIVVCLAVLALVVRRARTAWSHDNALAAITITALGSYLVSPITWGHHLYFLAPALVLVVAGRREWWRWPLVIPAMLVTMDPWRGGQDGTYSFWRLVVMVGLLFLVPTDAAPARPWPRRRVPAEDAAHPPTHAAPV
jgi:alpha-1,2-mannosyltransferase